MAASPSPYERTRCHRLGWAFERAGWLLILAATIAAALGVFGDGWLSSVEARAGALTVRYPRFARAHAPLDIVLEWTPERVETDLRIARSYLDGFEIVAALPAFTGTAVDSRRVYYTFRVRAPQSRLSVRLTLKPERAGRFSGAFGFDDGPEVVIRQFVFP